MQQGDSPVKMAPLDLTRLPLKYTNNDLTTKKQPTLLRPHLNPHLTLTKSASTVSVNANQLEKKNAILHSKNMKLIKEIKDLQTSGVRAVEDTRISYTDRHSERNKQKKGADGQSTAVKVKSRIVPLDHEEIPFRYPPQDQISYLMRCVEQRESQIANLKHQLSNQASLHNSRASVSSIVYKQKLEEKDQIIQSLMGQDAIPTPTPATLLHEEKELNSLKRQNYQLRVRVNQLSHQLQTSHEQRQQMQSMVCQLYFDNQFRSQQSQMISNLQDSCTRTRTNFHRLLQLNTSGNPTH